MKMLRGYDQVGILSWVSLLCRWSRLSGIVIKRLVSDKDAQVGILSWLALLSQRSGQSDILIKQLVPDDAQELGSGRHTLVGTSAQSVVRAVRYSDQAACAR
ncbi:hypothetical protein J6590_024596 [Homalodisca vitripennis]|nr:hypothetical protein J6590_024596 [Homalodisca vitripennis]